MRGSANRQKDVARMLRRRQKQRRPLQHFPQTPQQENRKPPIKKSKSE